MKKYLLLLLLLPALLYSESPRLYQFISKEENESFFILEIGTLHPLLNKKYDFDSVDLLGDIFSEGGVTLSLQSKGVELSGGYYFPTNKVALSSDLYLGSYNIGKELNLDLGVGGGIYFTSSIDEGFSSDILLRTPVRFKSNNFFIKFNNMIGSSMFRTDPRIRWNISFDIGYMFDLVNNQKSSSGNSDSSEDEDSKDEDSKDEDSKDEDSKDEDLKDEDLKDEDLKDEDLKDEDSKDQDSKDDDSKDE